MALPDDVWVEWAPTTPVNATPTAASWQTLAYPLKAVAYRRGIHRAAQSVEAGEATILFDNKSRALDPTNRLSPLWPNLVPRRPIRIRARHSGRVRTLWAGLTSGIYPTWQGRTATATIKGVDRRGVYADASAPTSGFRTTIAASGPRWWWPLDERGGATAYNRGSEPLSGTHTGVNLAGEPLTPYGSEGSAKYGSTGSSRTAMPTGVLTPPFTVMALAIVEEGPTKEQVIFGAGPGPIGFFGGISIAADAALFVYGPNTTGNPADAGRLNLTVVDSGGSVSSMITPRIDNGAPRLIIGRYGSDGFAFRQNIRVDNVQTSMASPFSIATRPGTVNIGNDGANAYPFKGNLSHVTVWNRYLTDAELTALWSAHVQPRVLDRPHVRLAWLLDQAQDLSPRALQEAGRELLGPYAGGLSVMEAADRAAASDGGIFLMDAEGRPTYFSRYHQGRVGGTYSTDPDTTPGATLQDLDIDMDERTFFTTGKASVATPNPIEVEVRHPNATLYGDLPWSPATEYLDPARADEGARRAIGEAAPSPHLTNASHYATAADMEEALDLDVWDTCTVVGHPPDEAVGPYIGWGVNGFWSGTLGWAGPPPVRQVSRVLEVDMAIDFVQKTTRKRMVLEPGRADAVQALTDADQAFEGGALTWKARSGLTTAAGAALPTTATTPIAGTTSGSMVAAGGADATASIDLPGTTARGMWAEAWLRPRTTAREVRLRLDMLNSAGAVVETITGPSVWETTAAAVRAVAYSEAQSTSVATVRLVAVVLGAAAGEEHLLDEARLWVSTDPVR